MGNTYNSDVSSIANVAIDREACSKCWYAAYVRVKCERKIACKFESLGYETFVPVQTELHQWSDRRKKIDRVVIPSVVFFRADMVQMREVERLSFVYSLLRYPGEKKAAIIPTDQIEQLRFMLGQTDVPIEFISNMYKKGDTVRIRRGALKGLIGQVDDMNDICSELSVNINFLGCARLSIETANVELVVNS